MTYNVLLLDLQHVCDEFLCGAAIWAAPLQRDPCDAGTHQPRSVGQVGQTSSRAEDHLGTKTTVKQKKRENIQNYINMCVYAYTHTHTQTKP